MPGKARQQEVELLRGLGGPLRGLLAISEQDEKPNCTFWEVYSDSQEKVKVNVCEGLIVLHSRESVQSPAYTMYRACT